MTARAAESAAATPKTGTRTGPTTDTEAAAARQVLRDLIAALRSPKSR
jgi:hypothetical protein